MLKQHLEFAVLAGAPVLHSFMTVAFALGITGFMGCTDEGAAFNGPFVPPPSGVAPTGPTPPSLVPVPGPGEQGWDDADGSDEGGSDSETTDPDAHESDTTPSVSEDIGEQEDGNDDEGADAEDDSSSANDADGGSGAEATTDSTSGSEVSPSGCSVSGCPDGEVCVGDQCAAVTCEPLHRFCGEDGKLYVCDPFGTQYFGSNCGKGTECKAGACTPPEPNYLIIFDTSGSMANVTIGTQLKPWPICDDPSEPGTGLGLAKMAFLKALTEGQDEPKRLGLMRFPQTRQWLAKPTCTKNYYSALPSGRMTGDNDTHALPLGEATWFDTHLDQVLAEPFPAEPDTGPEAVLRWMDFSESLVTLEGVNCAACPGFCDNGCHLHADPELRAGGGTPLGRSLYYAGEYLRRHVLVEGKPCAQDADCGSPHYRCENGFCHDPMGACRRTEILLFTDGIEAPMTTEQDFFNPINQAKRLFSGLGCADSADCAPGSTCVGSICVPAGDNSLFGQMVDAPPLGACATTLEPCQAGSFGQCPAGPCMGPWHAFKDNVQGTQALYGWDGNPLRVRVHVIDTLDNAEAAGVKKVEQLYTNPLTALYGGGTYTRLAIEDWQGIAQAIGTITLGKPEASCAQ